MRLLPGNILKIVYFKYFIFFVVCVFIFGDAISQQNSATIKTVVKENILEKSGKDKINLIYDLIDNFYQSSPDSSLYYYKMAYREARNTKDTANQINTLVDIGYTYMDLFSPEKSKPYLNEAVRLSIESGADETTYKCYTALGSYFYGLLIYDSALYYFHESLKIKNDLGIENGISGSYNNIGVIYYEVKDFENAISNLKRALEIKIAQNDTSDLNVEYYNIGLCYKSLGESRLAIDFFNKAIEIAKRKGANILPIIYGGLGEIYISTGEYDLAEKYLINSLETGKNSIDKQQEASNYFNLGLIESKRGDFKKAKDLIGQSKNIADEIGDLKINYQIFRLLAKIYDDQKKYDSAYYYQKLYTEISDSIFNEELAKNLANVQLFQQAEASQLVIAQKEEDINQRTKLSRLLATVLVLSILLIIIVTRNYIQTNRINKKLSISNFKIEKQKEVLESRNRQLAEAQETIKHQNSLLKNVNTELEKAVKERTKELGLSNKKLENAVKDLDDFIYKTSHDLRGPIATMQGIIKVGTMESKDESAIKYFNILDGISNRANRILNKLIEVHETYQKDPDLELINLESSIKAGIELAKKSEAAKSVNINLHQSIKGNWRSDKAIFISIIENMLNNAFLFAANKNAFVNLSVRGDADKSLVIVFEDNGFGILDADINKVFDVFFKGSPRRSGTGLEIYAARIGVEKLRGNIELKNPKDNTVFEITLPTI